MMATLHGNLEQARHLCHRHDKQAAAKQALLCPRPVSDSGLLS